MSQYRKTQVTVDLGALGYNVRALRGYFPQPVRLMAVVKANAYGHGLLPAAQTAVRQGADWLGVAMAEEGIALRQAGVECPILILGASNQAGYRAACEYRLTATIASVHHLQLAQAGAQAAGRALDVHLALDTGMGRIGIRNQEELRAILQAWNSCPQVALRGAFTHFADADNPDAAYSDLQLRAFHQLIPLLPEGLILHAAASSAALGRNDAWFDMVRIGIAMYGYPPVPTPLDLRPCLSLSAEIVHVKTIGAGDCVSYGCTFVAQGTMRVATLAVGYGDGYPRLLSSRGQVLIGGKVCPVLGRVCMDQMMVDVSGVPQAQVGGEAVLIGCQHGAVQDAQQVAQALGTIPYEILMAPKPRVPVNYVERND